MGSQERPRRDCARGHADGEGGPETVGPAEVPADVRARVRVGLAQAQRELAAFSAASMTLELDGRDEHAVPGERLVRSARARMWWGAVHAWTIAAERILHGTEWSVIAAHEGLSVEDARARWGGFVDAVVAGVERPEWTPRVPGVQVVGVPSVRVPSSRAGVAALESDLEDFRARVAG